MGEQTEMPLAKEHREHTDQKMAEVAKQIKEKDSASGDEDFPPPPPLPRSQVFESIQANQHFLPVPPPKETFSEIYQQRQKNELKRLFKHIHPDLRKNLDHVVDGELIETINPQASDTSSQGEVQSMRWIFENWTLDNIGDPHETKKLLDEENLGGGNVRGKSSLFEQSVFDSSCTTSTEKPGLTKGEVRIATCLFETQPLDSISRLQRYDEAIVEVVLKEPVQKGDVKGARLLFESKPINGLGHCCSVEDKHFLNLQSEIQESKGDVKKTIKLFQADPLCALRDSNGHIHKIKSICREEIQTGSFESARWLFETQPLDFINKETNSMQIIQGISLEEDHKGSFAQKKWMFETLPLDAIYDNALEEQQFQGVEHQTLRTEVKRELKKEAVVGGNVESTLWLFETQAIDTLKDGCDVGQLQKVTRLKEDSVQDNQHLGKTTSESGRKVQDDERGNVKTFKSIFEALPLGKFSQLHNADMEICEISAGNNSALETKPLYALKDCAGNLHGITTVSREENIKGNVQKYKWMFETKPLDQFEDTSEKVEVIRGITRQEDTASDERTAKWMFETQPLDETEDASVKPGERQAGNVKQFKWRFETQPLQINFEKSEKIEESVPRNSVKSQTWLFETQTLYKVNEEEFQLKLCKAENLKSDLNVKTVKHLFETEPLDQITKQTDTVQTVRCVSQVDVKSGDVSRVKDIFESKSFQKTESDLSTTEDRKDQIQPGSVNKCTWLFENQPIGEINEKDEKMTHSIRDVQGGDVGSMKFIFETSSMDKMQDKEQLDEEMLAITSGNVKASTMRFESQPLYAIKDKEGQFHVVNTVQKEEVRRGDVKGARWMFETNPIDTIHADNEIYVIRAVTQEDVLKGDVKSARWKFETQPLDSFTTCEPLPVNSEIEGRSKVQQSKVLFETTQTSQKYVRTVSVTDVQQGNVRTSTWLFESQPIDALRGESVEENNMKTVHREDNIKGDVKHCTWLFESQPLDQIKTSDDTDQSISSKEQVPKADVKSTTWLFETTPLDKITVESVTDVLHQLAEQSFIHSNGIIIQANDYKYVNMAKYQFVPNEGPAVQKEEIVEGNIRNIMMQLLFKPNIKPKVLILKDDEQGEIHSTLLDFPFQQPGSAPKPDAECKTQEAVTIIDSLLAQQKTIKSGLVMQESEGGQPEMTVYSLQRQKSTSEQQIARGDVKSTIGSLLATVHGQQAKPSCTLDQTERGNVNLYRDCIEKGELSHLQRLKNESDEESAASSKDLIEIVQGDVKEAKRHLNTQREEIEKTIIDIVPGDVKNAKKVFSRRPSDPVLGNCVPREEIIRGDVSSAKQQLDEAAKQSITVQKEEIVFGDIKSTLESLERAKQQSMHIEREVIKPGTIYDLNIEVQESDESETKFIKEEIISGDIKAAKRSLEKAKNQSIRVEKKSVTPGRLCDLDESFQYPVVSMVEQSTTSVLSNRRITTTFQKVSDIEKDYESARCCHPNKEGGRNVINVSAENVTTELDSNPELLNVEAERVRGDVKAAIQSLQHAASEQRNVDREELVKGNMKETLQSLEKSSINISKGDYKAAMLYRKAGQSHTQSKMKSDKQLVEHLFSSDTELSSSVSVTGNNCLSIISSDSSKLPSSAKGKQAQLIPQKPGQVNNQKPVMSPKPVFITDMPEDDPGTNHISTPVTRLKDNPTVSTHQSEQQKSKPVDSSVTNQPVQKTDYSLTDPEHFQRRQYTEEWVQNLQMDSTENVPFLKTNYANNAKDVPFTGNEENTVTQKKNDAEEISTSLQSYWKDNTETEVEHTVSPQKTLCLETTSFPKEPKAVTYKTLQEHYEYSIASENVPLLPEKHKNEHNTTFKEHNGLENKVVLREKKARRETEDERRQRLSVHKEEIMSGNVKAAMEIFEKLAKREELKIILSKVEEIEGETSEVDVKSQNVPSLDHAPLKNKHVALSAVGTGTENSPEDADSVSSVDAAFEDLEKASADILKLKEQTLAKLQDIEVAIKKALYSVSNLKSEADIAGLSGLFSESLTAKNISPGTNKIRKISIVSSKSKPKTLESHEHTSLPTNAATLHPVPTFHSCANLPSSPSFISIHSAARKSAESSTHQQSKANDQLNANSSFQQAEKLSPGSGVHVCTPTNAERKVSVLELQKIPDLAGRITGTKTVSEKFEEIDCFGNTYFSSKQSTFVSRQDQSGLSSTFTNQTIMQNSPVLQRSEQAIFSDNLSKNKSKKVCVTFSHPGKAD